MGTNMPIFKLDGEGPSRLVSLNPFCIDQTEVSNLQFFEFVQETGFVTEAEKLGDSFCFYQNLSENVKKKISEKAAKVPWWLVVKNASWLRPEGIDSHIYDRMNHPVVHISWNDALSYCRYFGKRLPTEAEWEYACRGDLYDRLYPWGSNSLPKGKHLMNIWQGVFPYENYAEDGFEYTAPVDSFNQNKFNMKNIVGNVWEWVSDWWSIDHYKGFYENPKGPLSGEEKVKKGGSFMCHPSFCHRYRCCSRSKNTPDSSSVNIGFRCAIDF